MLARDVFQFISHQPVTPRQRHASIRALKSEKSLLASACLEFWTRELARPSAISKSLIAFADAVYRLYGIRMKVAAVKLQLYLAARSNLRTKTKTPFAV